ncbi:MAG: hypothetical protein WC496_07250 [Phycisphaerae bacterium]
MHMDIDHCNVVMESLTGQRPADEQTFASINLLAEKLQAVRKIHRRLVDVDFSPQVQALVEQESLLAIS